MSHAMRRPARRQGGGFEMLDIRGNRSGHFPTEEMAKQGTMLQSAIDSGVGQLAPERPPFLHELNMGASRLQPHGLQALPQPTQMNQLQRMMQLFRGFTQPYGQDTRQAQLGTY